MAASESGPSTTLEGGWLTSSNNPIYLSARLPDSDNVTFIRDVTFPDNGLALTPGQVLTKTWRVRNSGTTTWDGYKLIFTGGHQMDAISPVNIDRTEKDREVDISITIQVPNTSSRGDWQIVNREGVWVPGGKLWVIVTVPGSTPPPIEDIEVVGVEFPSVVAPGQTFRPKVTVKVNRGQLLESRGDMLRNTDGNLYGAWPHVAVKGAVNAGQPYTFEFYENDPITAPSGEGTYESKWRVWRDGTYAGPDITIRFDVRNGGGTRPNSPTLSSPGNWYVSRDGSTPTLCANPVGGAEYYFDIYKSRDIPKSGWIGSNCWAPSGLGPYGYQWQVKVRVGGLESDWSETWHFNIESVEPVIEDVRFDPPSSSAADNVRIYACVRNEVEIYVNTATDGSNNGEWKWVSPPSPTSCDPNNPNHWVNWGTLPWEDGRHRIRLIAFKNGKNAVREDDAWVYELHHRRSDGTALISPVSDTTNTLWLNDRTVTFRWGRSVNAQGYRLRVSSTDNKDNPDIFSGTFGANDFSHTLTLAQDYPRVYWWLESFNDVGNSCCTGTHFGLDQTAPNSAVVTLPATTTETKFTVQWNGDDDRAGIRWYDVQYRDGEEGEWLDWQVNVTKVAEIFGGQPGHTYCFRSRAMDVAGNWEAYPDGNGDTCTNIDLSSASSSAWWDAAYAFKRNLVMLNNDGQSLPAGYPVRLHFDGNTTPTASELYNASQAATKGDDVRIVYQDQTQLPRYVQTFSSERIDIWFVLQAEIGPSPGSDNANYQLYYGNASTSNPPADPNLVFSPAVDSNTIGLWRFAEGTGTTIADSSGRGYNGAASNVDWLEGKFGWAGVFNGSNALVNLGNANEFNLSTLTAEAWVYFTEVGGERSFFIKRADDDSLIYDADTDGSEILLRLNGNSCFVRSNQKVEANRWYHLAWTYDGGTARVYINGELMNSSACGHPLRTGNSTLWLGGDGNHHNKYVKGHIQLARLSNIARTSFPYGGFGKVLREPSLATGDAIAQPQPGAPDLVVESLFTYNTADGAVVQAVVANQGDGATRNGFWVDLYGNHQPTGPNDPTGSIHYWVASPIDAGDTLLLTTLITALQSLGIVTAADQTNGLQEITIPLYAQADSKATVNETNKDNNISSAVELCTASGDAFENNDTAASATVISTDGVAQTHNSHVIGDEDWFAFNATAGVSYLIRTSNLGTNGDTYLYLYDTDATTLLASNDDYGDTLASQMQWQAPADGTYYLLVKHWNPNVGGCATTYDLTITSSFVGFEQTISASLTVSNPAVDFLFAGTAGTWVSLRMFSANGAFDPYLRLYAPDGSLVAENDNGLGISSNSFLSVQLPQDGTYRIETTRAGNGEGEFRLRLEEGHGIAVGDIDRNCSVNTVDIDILLSVFGTSDQQADLNLDSTVNLSDQTVLMANFGLSCGEVSATPTPTDASAPTGTPTDVPTNTPTSMATATASPINTSVSTATPTSTPTPIPTDTPVVEGQNSWSLYLPIVSR